MSKIDEFVKSLLSKETTKALADQMAITEEDLQKIRDSIKRKNESENKS